jgi:hydroxymethylpyrimidine/phosphomethylpyrimidine kinase
VVRRCLTIAGSDSGGGAGIQADLKAFARLGCHGTSAIVALTAQSTVGVSAIHEVPPAFVRAQLEAVFGDIGVDAAKTGMLFSARVVEEVALSLAGRSLPLVVDPVMISTSGARLLREDAVAALVARLFPLATVVTPNLPEACALAGVPYRDDADRRGLAEAIRGLGAAAVIITGGHGEESVDWLLDGDRHIPIPVERLEGAATHGSGCTHSAALTALLALGESLEDAAHEAAVVASEAVRHGLTEIGKGNGPVDVFALRDASIRAR